MPVQSVDLKRRTQTDWSLVLGKVGVWLAVVTFGGIFWAINGGFSVIGLEVVASSFNTAGQLFWAAVASIVFPVPVSVPGLPTTQPLVPWLGVLAASILQITVLYRKLRGKDIPRWMMTAAVLLSLYDMGTTFFGLGTILWVARAGFLLQGILAFVLTFLVELTVSLMLRK